jgi:hypothetical protein
MIPIFINIKGERRLSGKSENSLLNSKYRGGILFQKLYEYAISLCKERRMSCVWGFTTAAKVWRDKLHFSVYEDAMHESVFFLNIRTALTNVLRSQGTIGRRLFLSLVIFSFGLYSHMVAALNSPSMTLKRNLSIQKRPKSMKDVGTLYEQLRTKCPDLIHIDQDETYVTWRIFNNPNFKYRTYYVYEGNLLKAYCYFVTHDGKAYITDLTVEDDEAGVFLIRNLMNMLHDEKVGYISFIGNAKNMLMVSVFSLLRNVGFIKRKIRMPFVLRNLSYENRKALHDIRNWYLNALWTEGYTY